MLNSASTMYGLDVHGRLFGRGRTPDEDRDASSVRVARVASTVFVVAACLWAPLIGGFPGVFRYIQTVWGFVTPGIVAVFFAGVVSRRVPAFAARAGLLVGIPIYAVLRLGWPETAFLHHMGISFLILVAGLAFAAWRRPRTEDSEPPAPVTGVDLTPLPGVYWKGGRALATIAAIYLIFP